MNEFPHSSFLHAMSLKKCRQIFWGYICIGLGSLVVRIVTLISSVYSVFQFVFCLCSHAIHAQMEDSMFQQETAKGMRSAPEAAPKKASANVDDDFPIVSVSLLIILTSSVVTFFKYEGYYFLILECYTEEISIEDHTLGCYLYLNRSLVQVLFGICYFVNCFPPFFV